MMINQWVEDAYNRDRQSFPFKQLPRHFFAETKRFGFVAGFRPPFSGDCKCIYPGRRSEITLLRYFDILRYA